MFEKKFNKYEQILYILKFETLNVMNNTSIWNSTCAIETEWT